MSMNDPDWGRNSSGQKPEDSSNAQNDRDRQPPRGGGNQDGPPDLDELWRDFNNRLNSLFGGKKGGGGPRRPTGGGDGPPQLPQMPGAGKGLGVLAVVGVAFWLASGFFIIEDGNSGVVTQFGKYHHTASPGFQWRFPYPIQSHEVVNMSNVRIVEVGFRNNIRSKVLRESLMLTQDENIIDIQFAVQYRLNDARKYLFNSRNPDEAVMQAAETAIREVVGKNRMDFVLQQGREEVAQQTLTLIQGILDQYEVGILVDNVTVQNVQPPEQVQAAFDDVVKANQDRERMISEGRAYANDIVPRARGDAARLIEQAAGYKERIIAQAEGDAARFEAVLGEYSKAPQVTRERLFLDAMEEVYSNVSKVLVDSKENNQLMYLPLDRLIQGGSAVTDPAASGAASTVSSNRTSGGAGGSTALESSMMDRRDRDALRNRDRGVR